MVESPANAGDTSSLPGLGRLGGSHMLRGQLSPERCNERSPRTAAGVALPAATRESPRRKGDPARPKISN